MAPIDPDDYLFEAENLGKDSKEEEGWLCLCGHYEETNLHCSQCNAQPAWGCPCTNCESGETLN